MSTLANEAIRRVESGDGPNQRGLCQRFARLCVQSVYGHRYDHVLAKPTARLAGLALRGAGLGVTGKPKFGDLLYKLTGSGDAGHVGILTARGVAENSSTRIGRLHGALGYRSLPDYGPYDVCIRLPEESRGELQTLALRVDGKPIAEMPVIDDTAYVPVRMWAEALGLELSYDEEERRIYLDGKAVPIGVTIREGRAYLPIRPLTQWHGLILTLLPGEVRVFKAA